MPQSFAAAQKAALLNSRLDQISALGISESKIDVTDSFQIIENRIGDFINRVHANLESADMIVTGKIADITVEQTEEGANIMANPWLAYQDKGVNGSTFKLYDTPFSYKTKKPPVGVFIDWIETKNIQLRNNAHYKGKTSSTAHLTNTTDIESAAYAMREKVFHNGMPPKNVYSKEIEKLADDLAEDIAGFTVNNILQSFK